MKNNANAIIFYTIICAENVTNVFSPQEKTHFGIFLVVPRT